MTANTNASDSTLYTLPIIPLVNTVLLPHIVTKLTITRSEGDRLLGQATPQVLCVPLQPNVKRTRKLIDTNSVQATVTTIAVDLSQLFDFGCVAEIIQVDKSLPDQYTLRVKGICRAKIHDICTADGGAFFHALSEYSLEDEENYFANEALVQQEKSFRTLCQTYLSKMRAIGISPSVLNQFAKKLQSNPVPHVAPLLLCISDSPLCEKLRALKNSDSNQRIKDIHHVIERYLQTLNTHASPTYSNNMLYDHIRRKFYILLQMYTIDDISVESGHHDNNAEKMYPFKIMEEDDEDISSLITKLNNANLPDDAVKTIKSDLNRLRKMPVSAADSIVLRNYLEYIGDLPWFSEKSTPQSCLLNIASVKAQLDADHFGMDKVKRRVLEYLSVLKMKDNATPPILCFVGPPGVGKTTLGKSIATAIKRKFHRISLGGVRDEAEIRGHRRTYVGALPGLLIQGIRHCGVQNPVFLLDEIDKLVINSTQGDPAAALLEALDPAQNSAFTDHFINLPYDLSQVLFIATANSLDTIPRPLLDRLEVIQLDGYTFNEKLHIAQKHLIPKQIEAHGLGFLNLDIPEKVILYLAENYTRESGVRGLERLIASICRYKCREFADLTESRQKDIPNKAVQTDDLEKILGPGINENDVLGQDDIPGIVTGLAYSSSGNGSIMTIEANYMPGTGRLKLTGSLGDVIKESAHIALSWVKANSFALKLADSTKEDIFKDIDIHIHLPSGAIPKDGPSAGITMVTCLISLLSGVSVSRSTAMTGEVTLRGQVRPVGGIKEKVISAHRAGVKKVLLPAANRRDIINDIPSEICKEMEFIYCKSMWDVVDSAFEEYNIQLEPRFISSL
ncbi:Lon protease C-terminal proteolytic domain-containing protein [Mycotypha africana]|uniref:Lon protease C-terminal proteolytic domain-containing protein n=1 Tax=Mycotypha africana TaxID=64632 RepID=UPI0023017DB0|nr:Lon protease C-terminal proteolytic domain-containing protein [Mycotypha africana]KAI8975073.1 Lon protease C-terminal proteolytic domain-containing protein [Mycotypha africana]